MKNLTWQETYNQRQMDADRASSMIQDGMQVFISGNSAVPTIILDALEKVLSERQGIKLIQPFTAGRATYLDEKFQNNLRVNSLFISPNIRDAINNGLADFTPVFLSELPLLFKKGILPLDICILHLSPPNEEGFCTLGTDAGLMRTAAENARLRIAQINPQMPATCGDTLIHISNLDAIVEVDHPLHEIPLTGGEQNIVIDQIADHVCELIPDGATLQFGIGEIPNAIARRLTHRKDLGIHSELVSDGMMALVQAGAVTNALKSIHRGKITAGFLFGSRQLYNWAHQNDTLELQRTEYVNHPFTIAQNKKMTAINAAIEVDLTGQVCADSIGSIFYSGAGGQTDFIYGASLSEGGLPVIVLPSSYQGSDGNIYSRIVAQLKPGAGVITTRNHVHYVATEYGIVDLYGRSISQRVKLLISIAHPQFRDDLTQSARKLRFI